MPASRAIRALSALSWHTNGGQSWTTSDDFVSGSLAEGWGIGADAFGNVYVAGRDNGSGTYDSIVRTNSGGSWHTIDDYSNGTGATTFEITADAQGNLYTVSIAISSSYHWITRELPALVATIATPQSNSGGGYSTMITFNRTVAGFDLTDLTLTTPAGTVSGAQLVADGATLTTADNTNFVLTLPASLTSNPGAYILTLTAAGSGIVDANILPLTSDASTSWME